MKNIPSSSYDIWNTPSSTYHIRSDESVAFLSAAISHAGVDKTSLTSALDRAIQRAGGSLTKGSADVALVSLDPALYLERITKVTWGVDN